MNEYEYHHTRWSNCPAHGKHRWVKYCNWYLKCWSCGTEVYWETEDQMRFDI